MQKGVKFRIYPNREQQNIINQTLGCCRLIYNKGLAMRNEAYQNGNKIGYSQTSAMLTDLKKSDDFAFLKAVDSIALQQSLRDLDRGFVNFFQKRAKHPQFKSKHSHHQSYRTINQSNTICQKFSILYIQIFLSDFIPAVLIQFDNASIFIAIVILSIRQYSHYIK